jgi:hypothetical protein
VQFTELCLENVPALQIMQDTDSRTVRFSWMPVVLAFFVPAGHSVVHDADAVEENFPSSQSSQASASTAVVDLTTYFPAEQDEQVVELRPL